MTGLSVNGVINNTSSDGDKLHWTHVSTGSKVAHSSGWCVDYYAGSSGDASAQGNHKFFTSNSSAWVERMRIANTGNVGIGTNNPVAPLHLSTGSSSGNHLYMTNDATGNTASDGFRIGLDANNHVYIYQNEAKNMRFGTNQVERMTIDNNGNVGIGTDSPSTKLHLANGDIRIAGTTSSKGGIEIIPMKVTQDGGGRIFFREQNDDNYGFFLLDIMVQ